MRKLLVRLPHGLLLFGLFLLSLLPRLVALRRYITPDELIWVFRTVRFREAMLAGQWADSLVSGHPGVVTTWLGMLGISGQLLLRPADTAVYQWITHLAFFMPDNMAAFSQLAVFLPSARLLVAVVNSMGVTAVYLLVRRLWGNTAAGLAFVLLAFDPFVVGLSGILHVDALMATFAILALLTLLQAVDEVRVPALHQRRRYLAAAAFLAALAVLSKTPALLLVPVTGLILLVAGWRGVKSGYGRFRPIAQSLIIWSGVFAATILLAYPALWGGPASVVALLSGNAGRHIEEALRPTFFMGRVSYEQGWLFYPMVLLFRLSPVVLLGLVPALWLLVKRNERRWGLALLFLWTVLYLGGISLAAKKFDRYALAVIPALIVLVAAAWSWLAQAKPRLSRWLLPILVGTHMLYWLAFLPYPLAAYNPLVGGPWVAQKVLPLGWGEAVSAAGRWLAEQPDAMEKTAVTGIPPALAPFFPGQTLLSAPETIPQADYLILTANSRQDAPESWPGAAVEADFELLHTIHFGGLDQAWIYAQPNPQKPDSPLVELAEPISFGGRVSVLAAGTAVNKDELDFVVRWRLLAGGENGRYTVKLTLRDKLGHEWVSREWELVNEVYFYPEHWPDGTAPEVSYALDLPPGLPPAAYDVELSLFDAAGAQLPLLAGDGQFAGVVWVMADIALAVPAAADLPIPEPTAADWLDGRLLLLGHGGLPQTIVTGGTAVIDLFWQAADQLPDGVNLTLSLGETELHRYPISRFDSGRWLPGQQLHEKYSLNIPPQMTGGRYPLRVQVGEDTAVTLGEIEIIATDRLFRLPDTIDIPLAYQFAGTIHLRGLDWPAAAVRPGDSVALTLYWQTEAAPPDLISAFVHLVGPDGSNVAQADRWPGGRPSDTWAAGEVIVDEYAITLPPDAPPGEYQVAVGLYTAVDGLRLPAVAASGTAVPDNRVILPVTLTVGATDE